MRIQLPNQNGRIGGGASRRAEGTISTKAELEKRGLVKNHRENGLNKRISDLVTKKEEK